MHITLEIPFNSSAFVQQLGRTHRSNQVTGPEYVAVVTDLPVRFGVMMPAVNPPVLIDRQPNIQTMQIPPTHVQGEIRFASTAAKRLAQLGAITQGDRMACMGASDFQASDHGFVFLWIDRPPHPHPFPFDLTYLTLQYTTNTRRSMTSPTATGRGR